MKKKYIIILVIVIITGVLGITFISLGLRNGLKVLNNSKVEVSANSGGSINKSYSITQNIKEIYLEINAIEFEVVRVASATDIKIELKNFLREEHMRFNVDGNTLTVKSLDAPLGSIAPVLVRPSVIISIPDNIELDILDANSRASDTYLNNINAKKVVVRNDAGKFIFSGNVASSIDIENNVGKVDITLKTQSKNITVDNNIGDVNVKTLDIKKYNYNIKNNLGHVKVGDRDYSGLQNEISSANVDMNIKINNKVGAVSIF